MINIEGYPLSPQQRHLWQLQQKHGIFRALQVLHLDGHLDRTILNSSLVRLVGRHEVLRTCFVLPAQVRIPLNVVSEQGSFSWYETAYKGDSWFESFLDQERTFPLSEDGSAVLRVSLLEVEPERFLLVLNIPVLCGDQTSLINMFRELGMLYDSHPWAPESEGCEDDEPVQYCQFSEWLFELEEDKEGIAFWTEWLKVLPAAKALPFPSNNGFSPSCLRPEFASLPLEQGVSESLLLACWYTFLMSNTGTQRPVVAVGFDGRDSEGLQDVLGMLARFIPISLTLDQAMPFEKLVERVDALKIEVADWQDFYGLGDLMPKRPVPYAFSYQKIPQSLTAGDLVITPSLCFHMEEAYALKLAVREIGQRLHWDLYFDAGQMSINTATNLAHRFHNLVTAALANPGTAIGAFPILTAVEREQVLFDFNQTTSNMSPTFVCQLFEAQVEAHPDRVALVFGEQQLSFARLNGQANQLAHKLREYGLKPDQLVGICLPRSQRIIVAILAIFKAGGGYLALDPNLPKQRLEYMLADSGACALITDQGFHFNQVGPSVIDLDRDRDTLMAQSEENLLIEVEQAHLAYAIYTSGSTGKPKGVMIEHRNLNNYLHAIRERFAFAAEESFALVSTLAADLGNTVLFPPLCSGGTLHLIALDMISDAYAFGTYMHHHKIDNLKITPSHIRALMKRERPAEVLPHKRLILGGESTSWELLESIQEIAPRLQIHNHYGPSETTVGVLTCFYNGLRDAPSFPLGRPLANSRIYILNSYKEPVPPGVAGELYIGGGNVTRGYINLPELTSQRFLEDPFLPDSRVYRSGDAARFLPDGRVEFLGRIDRQVKIQGYRVELEEVEISLQQHPQVNQAYCTAWAPENSTSQVLVAYLIPGDGPLGGLEIKTEVRHFLESLVPAYMIPTHYIILESLPLTPNGKVDPKALPEPGSWMVESTTYVAPRNHTERKVSQIWSQVLNVEKVGREDNFFSLGGHSISGTIIMSRTQETFKVEMRLPDIFEEPTVSGLSLRIQRAQIRTAQPERVLALFHEIAPGRDWPENIETLPGEILEELTLKLGDEAVQNMAIIPASRANGHSFPLSFAQQRLWFLDHMRSGQNDAGLDNTYNMTTVLGLRGPLDVKALEAAFNEIKRRHESLRTTFALEEGEPVQRIEELKPFMLPIVDLSNLPQSKRLAIDLITREAQLPFSLSLGPLWRVTIFALESNETILLLTIHHIISDGWSKDIMVRELMALYAAYQKGLPSPLQPLPIQYVDYASWQHRELGGRVFQEKLAYWNKKLTGAPAILELATDRPRPSIQTHSGGKVFFSLDESSIRCLKEQAQQMKSTLFVPLYTAFSILLARYSGQRDIIVGTPITNRNRKETQSLIGFFVNTLALRLDVSGELSYSELLTHARQTSLEAFSNQDIPFGQIVDALQPERSLSHSPLFQIMFTLENEPEQELSLPGLKIYPALEEGTTQAIAKFDLSLTFSLVGKSGLHGCFTYNSDLFDHTSIERMAEHFKHLLEGISTHYQCPVAFLPILGEAERHTLLLEWNKTETNGSDLDQPIHVLFETQAAQTPDGIALVWLNDGAEGLPPNKLTYAELNQRANRLARRLQASGAGPDVPICLCAERSLELCIGLLAILKAGSAYIPLDPAHPHQRISLIIEVTQAPILLTQQHLVSVMPKSRAKMVVLDHWKITDSQEVTNLPTIVHRDNLAYIIYTSGSTGEPKGVMVSHRAIANRLLWARTHYPLTTADRFMHLASFSFDISLWELMAPLITGGQCLLADGNIYSDPARLLKILDEHQVTAVHFVPSLLQLLLQHGQREELASLHTVFCGGEKVDVEIKQYFFQKLNASLIQFYGPTEAAINMTAYTCDRHKLEEVLPIGRPIDNAHVYILDRNLNLAPLGVPGQLCIGGVPLARGYVARPAWSAEKFIPHPYSVHEGDRLYQSGDLARYLPDGNLQFLGRVDHQVKVRGFRVEPGEIEQVILTHSGVAQAVVIAQSTGTSKGDKRLVAFVTSAIGEGDGPDGQEAAQTFQANHLRLFLQDKMPNYMIPTVFVEIEQIPLNANGKVDRKALEATGNKLTRRNSVYVPPRDTTGLKLVRIWEEVLAVQPIGILDNFFDIGGHSLLAVRLMAKIQQELGVELPLATLFQGPTIEQLNNLLRDKVSLVQPPSPLVTIQGEGTRPPFFCIHPAGGNVLHYMELARSLGDEQPFLGVQYPGLYGGADIDTIERMASYYIEFIRDHQAEGPYHIGGFSSGALIAYEMARQLRELGLEIGLLALIDGTNPESMTEEFKPDKAELLVSVVKEMSAMWGQELEIPIGVLKGLEEDEMLDHVLQLAASASVLPPEIGRNQWRRLWRVFYINSMALYQYRPKPYPGKATLFLCQKTLDMGDDQAKAWGKLAQDGITSHTIPGDHNSMLRPPNVGILSSHMKAYLSDTGKPD